MTQDNELTEYERQQRDQASAGLDGTQVRDEFAAALDAVAGKAVPPAPVGPKPFEFTRREGEPLTLETAVFEALGAASTCWTEQRTLVHEGKYGDPDTYRTEWLFNDTRAREIGQKLIAYILTEWDENR